MMVGPLKAPPEYSIGSGPDDPRMPELLLGDIFEFRSLQDFLGPKARVRHFTLSYAEEDRPSRKALVEDTEAFLRHLCARFPQPFDLDRLDYIVLLHCEAAGDQIGPRLDARKLRHRLALHLHVFEYDLLTGKRIQLYYSPAHKSALGAWLKAYNQKRGYACPTDPRRSRRHQRQWPQTELNALAKNLAEQTIKHTSPRNTLTADAWANLLRPHCHGGVIDCYARGDRLAALIRVPGVRSRTALILHPDQSLDVRAAKANPPKKGALADAASSRFIERFTPPAGPAPISGKPAPLLDSGAGDVLAPTMPGAPTPKPDSILPEIR